VHSLELCADNLGHIKTLAYAANTHILFYHHYAM